ncbi:Hypothetical protein, putative [Bodo saltans]|uniref:Uncharacterized protein n=1 Tax=Bodo saltans TaxID=75058 RepID=A0A0S4IY63_BODSA|nr:Hypothetical protein, putative [Bodo saltans]|eukprot:CUG14431.1 Hypothetical protein, putative [Bodo saltans]
MFQAQWRRLDEVAAAPSSSSCSDRSLFAPCPRRFHVTGVVYIAPQHPPSGRRHIHTAEATSSSSAAYQEPHCTSSWRKLLVLFGGKTTTATQTAACSSSQLLDVDDRSLSHQSESSNQITLPIETSVEVNRPSPGGAPPTEGERYLGGVPFVFDVAQRRWLSVQVVNDPVFGAPLPRAYHAAAVHENQLIICGGKTTSSSPLATTSTAAGSTSVVLGDVWVCTFTPLPLGEGNDRTIVATWSRRDSQGRCDATSSSSSQSSHGSVTNSMPSDHTALSFTAANHPMCYHTCVLLSSSQLVCHGGNDGKRWDDTIRVFDLKTNRWVSQHTAVPVHCPTSINSSASASSSCDCSWPQNQFCVHSSKTLRPVLFRKLLASQQQLSSTISMQPSCPPREGHSTICVPRRRTYGDGGVAAASVAEDHRTLGTESLFTFGGEVALTTFNTLLKLDVNHSSMKTEWSVLSGGGEYPHSRTDASPPRQHLCFSDEVQTIAATSVTTTALESESIPQIFSEPSTEGVADECPSTPDKRMNRRNSTTTHADEEASPLVSSPGADVIVTDGCYEAAHNGPAVAAGNNGCVVISISESPPRHFVEERRHHGSVQQGSHCVGGPLPEHRAFHTAWPSGSSGMLVYGGVCRGGHTVMSSLRRYDCIVGQWVDVSDPLDGGAHHPGPRASCPVATQPEPAQQPASPRQCCDACGAPSDPCFMVGGESSTSTPHNNNIGGASLAMDVWQLDLHYGRCAAALELHRPSSPNPQRRCFMGLTLGGITPTLPLTPPPHRRHVAQSSNATASSSFPPPAPLDMGLDPEMIPTVLPAPIHAMTNRFSADESASMKVSLLPLKLLLGMYIKDHMPQLLEQQRQHILEGRRHRRQ